mmetsp:Transcript_15591/g.36776  ORF Transcript_15591/g.36776 Transcript_15591/m.36776 type:complete len:481 (+) Transcript_15591:70-1512(+)
MAEEEGAEVPPEPVPPLTEEELAARAAIFEEIFKDFPALEVKQKSMAERKEKEAPPPVEEGEDQEVPQAPEPNIALAYSELSFAVMNSLINFVKEKNGPLFPSQGVFLDLGSGAGKNCLAAALLNPFQKIIGVETLQSLNDVEAAAQAKYAEVELPEGVVKPEISFVKGDFTTEFESVLEGIAPEVTVAVVVATTFGDAEMQAVAKLAQKMPEGASLITVTQTLEESLVVDVNREPRKRRASATRKALAQRGVEPKGIEIELEAAENDPNGWRLKHTDSLELEWGTTTCYLYKKYTYPFCDVGDICMATPLPEVEDQTVAPAYYAGPTKVRYMDDMTESEVEVAKIAPFCEESRKKAVKLYLQKFETEKAKAASGDEAVAEAMAKIREEHETFAQDGKLTYKLDEGSVTEKLLAALKASYGLPADEKVDAFVAGQWTSACEGVDAETTGSIPETEVLTVWKKVKAGLLGVMEGKLEELRS